MTQGSPLKERVQKDVQARFLSGENPMGTLAEVVETCLRDELKKPGAATKDVIDAVCHGALSGLVVSGADVPAGAMQVLKSVGSIVQERSGDPMRTMTYALEGMARIASVAGPGVMEKIGSGIDAQFMGAGQIFSDLSAKYR